ncbi:WD-repeat protein, partial [Reticulomyxa filosa]
ILFGVLIFHHCKVIATMIIKVIILQLILFKGHESRVNSVRYGSNELRNIILSGSHDKSIRLWDIRSGKQFQMFNGHKDYVWYAEYSPFVIKNNIGNSNVLCSGSYDNTIRFWDIRSNKSELYVIKGDKGDDGITCLKFMSLKKKVKSHEQKPNNGCGVSLCYGSYNGPIFVKISNQLRLFVSIIILFFYFEYTEFFKQALGNLKKKSIKVIGQFPNYFNPTTIMNHLSILIVIA